MSVPRRSQVTSTIPKHRLPTLLVANSRDMWKCYWDTVKNEASLLHLLNCSTFYGISSKFELDNVKTQEFCKTSSSSSRFERGNVKTKAILRDFLKFWMCQRQKRRNSARLPQFSKLTTTKTKQFWETSFKHGKLSAELTALYQCVFAIFRPMSLKYCACHEKLMSGHTKCCTCHAKLS